MRLFERGSAAEEDVYRRLSFDPQCDTLIEEIAQARQEIEMHTTTSRMLQTRT